MREFLLASPLSPNLTTGAPPSIATITASENGVVHLDRLLVGAAATNEQIGYDTNDLNAAMQVDGVLINGSIELIRGRNAPGAPGGVFSPARQQSVISLGDWVFGTGDTVAMTAQTTNPGSAGVLSICAPFSPRNKRLGYTGVVPAVRETYAGSPVIGVAGAGGAGNIVITFDQDGVCDLSSLFVSCAPNPKAAGGNNYADLTGAYVTQITLPSGDQLILGQAQFGVPAAIFSPFRSGHWWSPGFEWVSAGSTVVVAVNQAAAQPANFAAGLPFYPGTKGDLC